MLMKQGRGLTNKFRIDALSLKERGQIFYLKSVIEISIYFIDYDLSSLPFSNLLKGDTHVHDVVRHLRSCAHLWFHHGAWLAFCLLFSTLPAFTWQRMFASQASRKEKNMILTIIVGLVIYIFILIMMWQAVRGQSMPLGLLAFCMLFGYLIFVNQFIRIHQAANVCVADVQEVHPDWAEKSNDALHNAVEDYKFSGAAETMAGEYTKQAKSLCFDRLKA